MIIDNFDLIASQIDIKETDNKFLKNANSNCVACAVFFVYWLRCSLGRAVY